MEAAGVAGTSIAVVQLLSHAIFLGRGLIDNIRNQEFDAATLTTRMSMAMDRAEAFHKLLFKHQGENDITVFGQLRHRTRDDVTATFQQYYYLIHVRYRAFREAYRLANSSEQRLTTAEKQSKQQVLWQLGGKKRFQAMVESCEQLNTQLYETLQLYILERSVAERGQTEPSPLSLEQLQRDTDAQFLQLDNQVEMIRISSNDESGPLTGALDGARVDLEVTQTVVFTGDSSSPSRRVGTYLGRTVVVEFKHFIPRSQDYHEQTSPRPSDVAMRRINQLAILLNKANQNSSRLLRCAGFYRSPGSLSYGFILEFPTDRTRDPKTLLDVISEDWKRSKLKIESTVPLETRLNMALNLAVSVFQLHARNWVHKSLRSENILFFPATEDDGLCESLNEPWVSGFEYAREEADQSETPPEYTVDPARDIYKHPARWGVPTIKFDKRHDIYSLGVVLLEIGLWQPIAALEASGFRNLEPEDRIQIQTFLLKKAAQKLPFRVGTAYATVVKMCLTGIFEVEMVDGGIEEELFKYQVRFGY